MREQEHGKCGHEQYTADDLGDDASKSPAERVTNLRAKIEMLKARITKIEAEEVQVPGTKTGHPVSGGDSVKIVPSGPS